MRDNPSRHIEYLELLKQETDLVQRSGPIDFSTISSVYIGGGTPSCFSIEELSLLINWIRRLVNPRRCKHWSIELNPDDITSDYANGLKGLGFTRVSLGIQSFHDDLLNKLNRIHKSCQSDQAIESVVEAGFSDFNIDLMFGFPTHDLVKTRLDIDKTLSYKPTHISAYSLTIEPKTSLNRQPAWKDWIQKHDDLISKMYETITERLLTAGFNHYEVSNFAKEGFESLQNLIYWNRKDYLGLGTGAHSLISGKRWGNMKRLTDYRQNLKKGCQPLSFVEDLTPTMKRDESIMLGLRLSQGIDTDELKHRFMFEANEDWNRRVKLYCENGFMRSEKGILKLTVKGMLVADELTAELCSCLS